MVIFPPLKLVLFSVYKTAGKAVTTGFTHISQSTPVLAPGIVGHAIRILGNRSGLYPSALFPPWPMFKEDHHICAAEAFANEDFQYLKNYRKVFILRNPWDWEVSYHYFHRKNERTIEAFRKKIKQLSLQPDSIPRPPERFLMNSEGKPFDFNYIRFENLQADFDSVCKRLRLPTLSLEVRDFRKEREDYRTYYDSETIDLVAKMHAKYLAFTGYEFDDGSVRQDVVAQIAS